MTTYTQSANKRQKTVRDPPKSAEINEYFPGINKIEFKGESVPYDDTLCYRYYNANERIHGRTMEDWIRPAVSFTAFRSIGNDIYGRPTFQRSWDDHSQSLENRKRFIKAGFEFCCKLNVKHWTAFDRDLIPEMETHEENCANFDEISELVQDLQQKTGMKPLWIAPDLHTSPKYASGAGSSYDSNIMVQAAQQVKKCLEVAQKLNSECYLLWSAREGYASVLSSDVQREMKHFARLLKMTSDYKERLGYRGQLLLQPSPINGDASFVDGFEKVNDFWSGGLEGLRFPYCWDATSCLCFLKHYNLDRSYKLCVKPGHQLNLAIAYNSVGIIDISQNDNLNIRNVTFMMKNIIEQGGIQPGGINLRITPNRDSVDSKDLFIAYISYIDMLARSLRISTKLLSDQTFSKNLQQRYISYYSGFGSRLSNGEATLEECEEHVRKFQCQCPDTVSTGRKEHWEAAFENFINYKNN